MSLTASSIGRKVAMALSGIFLVLFLTQHFSINLLSVFSESLFNQVSHFMGNNPIVQFILQPILIFGVLFHFVMGFVLELQNSKSRSISYSVYKGKTNASWMSRNMILSGIVILSFLSICTLMDIAPANRRKGSITFMSMKLKSKLSVIVYAKS